MADRARVTSVEAIEAFRARLIVYLSKARPTLEEVSSELMRTRQWLQNDQRRYWENECRVRGKKLERAQAELFSATTSRMQQASSAQQMAVRKAKAAFDEAQEKLARLKKWDRELENRSEPLLKLVDQLHDYTVSEMPRAVTYLDQVVRTLDAYANVAASGRAARTDEPPAGNSAGEGERS